MTRLQRFRFRLELADEGWPSAPRGLVYGLLADRRAARRGRAYRKATAPAPERRTDNAAFGDPTEPDHAEEASTELRLLLRRIAGQIARGARSAVVMDSSGNTCGAWKVHR